jgi:hypothetical protein
MTSFTENMKTRSYIAGGDLSTSAQRFVARSGANVVAAGAGVETAGVLIVGGTAGQAVSVAYDGVVQVIAGGAITAGDAVTPDADAAAVAATTGDVVAGYARQTAVAGQIISVDIARNANTVA